MQLLRQHIESVVRLTDEEFALIRSAFSEKKLQKGKYILLEGGNCDSDHFVLSGSLMQYEPAQTDREFFDREFSGHDGNALPFRKLDAGPLTFVPYSAIDQFEIKSSFWMGKQLYLSSMPLTALGVLSDQEKTELCDHINSMKS